MGIGADFGDSRDGIWFEKIYEDEPAAQAGLRGGDRIVAIDGQSTEGMTVAEAIQRIRGEAGTSVTIGVRRPETQETPVVTIVRQHLVR